MHLFLAVVLPGFAQASDLHAAAERWQTTGRMVLVTPERLEAWGASFDPVAMAARSDFAIDIGPHPPMYCPPFPPFNRHSYVGELPWTPYNGGCREPTGLDGLHLEADHVDLTVLSAALLPNGPTSETGWVVRIASDDKQGFLVRWTAAGGEPTWSSPIAMVESPESSLERLRRWQEERAPGVLERLGAQLVGGVLTSGGQQHAVTVCRVVSSHCDESVLAVECNTATGSLLVDADGIETRDQKGRGGDACVSSSVPGGG